MEGYNIQNLYLGIKAAVILEKLIYYTASNILNGREQHRGKTYVKIAGGQKALSDIVQFSLASTKYNLKKLHKADLIDSTNEFNINKYDKTLYYLLNQIILNDQIQAKIKAIKPEATAAPTIRQQESRRARVEETPRNKYQKHFDKWFYKKFRLPPPKWNNGTIKAFDEILKKQQKIIVEASGKEANEESLIQEIDWLFYAAHKDFNNELQKFNVVYINHAFDRLHNSKLHLVRKHNNKIEYRKFFINH